MSIPLFNYSPDLYKKVHLSGILFSEDSILKLKCLGDGSQSANQREALVNFELCKSTLIKNSYYIYQNGSVLDMEKYEDQFSEWMTNCALILELHDWTKYKSMANFNLSSFVSWEDERILTTRRLSDLL